MTLTLKKIRLNPFLHAVILITCFLICSKKHSSMTASKYMTRISVLNGSLVRIGTSLFTWIYSFTINKFILTTAGTYLKTKQILEFIMILSAEMKNDLP